MSFHVAPGSARAALCLGGLAFATGLFLPLAEAADGGAQGAGASDAGRIALDGAAAAPDAAGADAGDDAFVLATTPIAPGEYLMAGSGTLTVKAPVGAGQAFTLETVGDNGHMCSMDGTVVRGRATLKSMDTPCVVTFTRNGNGTLEVAGPESCRMLYCGARAHFGGRYVSAPPMCTRAATAKTRDAALLAHRAKRYDNAIVRLTELLAVCDPFLSPFARDWVRNDLAVAQGKAGRLAECRATLKPLEELAGLTDDAIRQNNLPGEAYALVGIAKATRFNLKLCAP